MNKARHSSRPARCGASFLWRILILVLSAPVALVHGGNLTSTLFSTSFEASEGYQLANTLAGQNDWGSAGSGGDGLLTNALPGQIQSAYLGFNPPTDGSDFHAVGYSVNIDPVAQHLPRITFSVQMAVFPSSSTNQEWFDWAVFNKDGQKLFALEFPTGTGDLPVYYKIGSNDYQDTGQTYTSQTAYQLTVSMDFSSNRWNAVLGSAVLVTNQPISTVTTNALTLGNIDGQWIIRDAAHPGDDYMVFDDYQVNGEFVPPAGSQILYATSFESAEGFQPTSTLSGQNDWLSAGSGGDGIITNALPGELQSAFLGFGSPTNGGAFHAVGYHVDFNPIERQLPLVTFSVRMAVFPSSTTNQEWFDWAVYNTDGKQLIALEFPTGNGALPVYSEIGDADYKDTGQTYTSQATHLLTLNMDFAANRWAAMLDASQLVTNQPITLTNVALTLGNVDAQWFIRDPKHPGDDYLLFDQYQIVAEPAPGSTPLTLQFVSGPLQGTVKLRLTGAAGTNYTLQASSDLRTWMNVETLPATGGVVSFTEAVAQGMGTRFYRAQAGAGSP